MKSTRSSSDSFTTMKIPESLIYQLRVMAARKNKYIYQVVAELLLREFESNQEAEAR